MNKLSIYNATYGRLDEMSGVDRIVSEQESGDYVDGFDESDMKLAADAQDIASMAAQQHSGGNIDQLAYELGYDASYDSDNNKISEGEILINAIKMALSNGEADYTEIFREYESGESIVPDIDFMNNLR